MEVFFFSVYIILLQISPKIVFIIRDPSELSSIMTKPPRIRFFYLHNGAELECRPRDLLNASEGIFFFLGDVEHSNLLA